MVVGEQAVSGALTDAVRRCRVKQVGTYIEIYIEREIIYLKIYLCIMYISRYIHTPHKKTKRPQTTFRVLAFDLSKTIVGGQRFVFRCVGYAPGGLLWPHAAGARRQAAGTGTLNKTW